MVWSSPRTFVTGETVTAAHLNQEIRDNLGALNPLDSVSATSWTPTLQATTANPTVVSVTGRYWRVGPLVYAAARFVLGGPSGQGSGTYFVTLPVTASGLTAATGSDGQVVGSWRAVDASASANNENGSVTLQTSSRIHFGIYQGTLLTDSTPVLWSSGDVLAFQVMYPAA